MINLQDTERVQIWEKIIYYFLWTLDILYYGMIKLIFLAYWLVHKIIFICSIYMTRKKTQKNPFLKLKSQTPQKKLLLLDLDGTLVCSSQSYCEKAEKIKVGGEYLYIKIRPNLQQFIKEASKLYQLGVYTSSIPDYADKVIYAIGLEKVIPKNRRLYRNSCDYVNGNYMKRVTKIEADLRNVLILDNRPEVVIERKNILQIKSWEFGEDHELIRCLEILKKVYDSGDIRCFNY